MVLGHAQKHSHSRTVARPSLYFLLNSASFDFFFLLLLPSGRVTCALKRFISASGGVGGHAQRFTGSLQPKHACLRSVGGKWSGGSGGTRGGASRK